MIQAKNSGQASTSREDSSEAQFTTIQQSPPGTSQAPLSQRSVRREHARYKVELDVSLGSEHNFYAGFVENMSAGGVFIATHMIKKCGEIVDVSIRVPNSVHVVRGIGEVRWVREFSERSNVPPGIGIRFIELEPGSQEAIQEFLARREPMFFDEE